MLCLKCAIAKLLPAGTGDPVEVISIFGLLLEQCLDFGAMADTEEVTQELLKYLKKSHPGKIPQEKVVNMLVKLWNTGN